MQLFTCAICAKSVPSQFKNEHHIRPQSAGGTDADLVSLCAGCHQNLHAIEKMLNGPSASQAKDVALTFYKENTDAAHRCLKFAVESAKWMSIKADGKIQPKPHEEVDLTITVPYAVKSALAIMGAEARDPMSGKRLGISGVLRQLVLGAVFRTHPKLKTVIAESQREAAASGEGPRGPRPSRAVMESLKKKSQ